MNKLAAVVVVLVLLYCMPGCKAGKNATKNKKVDTTAVRKNADTTTIANNANGITPQKQLLIDSLMPVWNKVTDFKTFAGKARMHYEAGDQKQDFTANIRIQKDKIIWVSATALGGIVQVARIYITPDSFKMINYLEKSVTMMTLKQAGAILPTPMDYSILQNLIIGNVLSKTDKITDAVGFPTTWSLQTEGASFIQQVTFNKADSSIHSEQFRDKKPAGPTATIQYANYVPVEGKLFSFSRAINIANAGQQYFLDMNYLGMDFDRVLDYPFSIPKNYLLK